MKLRDKVAVVTGAGRGIGRAIALAFAREGADLVLVSRTKSEVEETAAQVEPLGGHCLPLRVDVSDRENVENMVRMAVERFGRIDVLVNNAGILGPIGSLVENDVDKWIETVRVNLIGTLLCCKAVLPVMVRHGRGKIINLSGGGAAYPRPRFSAYATSKAAVVRLTETLAEESKESNIQVNAIAPGAINTRLQEEILAAGEVAGEKALAEAKKVEETGGTPLDVPAALAVFLASDESDGLTGKLISAVWDDWRSIGAERIKEIELKGLYTLRRIDGVFFYPKDGEMPRR
jgi:NAD(P)-dependent dehydrogenase (short-subunit alcohol dehydrogenase family)